MKSIDVLAVETLLADRIGLDPSTLPRGMLPRAIRVRMDEAKLGDIAAYARRLAESESELLALTEEIVVPESWFFRDERPFTWLRDQIAARWLAQPALPSLRLLSLPCSSGEEPYSIAMTLRRAGLTSSRFIIDAVDVSARRLELARAGIYTPNAFRGPAAAATEGFFRPNPNGFEIDPAIRALARFHQANVLDPDLLRGAQPYHVVFCRNLLIYLGETARARVEATLDRLVEPEGWLVLGHADRLGTGGRISRFKLDGEPGCFTYRRASPTPAAPANRHHARPRPALQPPVSPPRPLATPGPERTESLLAQAESLANQKRYPEAIAACDRLIRVKGPTAPAYHLLGTIHQAQGDPTRAEDCFRKTVYLDPHHELALLSLALLAERKGDPTAAAGFRRRAKRRHAADTT